jgi:hypothetical protein
MVSSTHTSQRTLLGYGAFVSSTSIPIIPDPLKWTFEDECLDEKIVTEASIIPADHPSPFLEEVRTTLVYRASTRRLLGTMPQLVGVMIDMERVVLVRVSQVFLPLSDWPSDCGLIGLLQVQRTLRVYAVGK